MIYGEEKKSNQDFEVIDISCSSGNQTFNCSPLAVSLSVFLSYNVIVDNHNYCRFWYWIDDRTSSLNAIIVSDRRIFRLEASLSIIPLLFHSSLSLALCALFKQIIAHKSVSHAIELALPLQARNSYAFVLNIQFFFCLIIECRLF